MPNVFCSWNINGFPPKVISIRLRYRNERNVQSHSLRLMLLGVFKKSTGSIKDRL